MHRSPERVLDQLRGNYSVTVAAGCIVELDGYSFAPNSSQHEQHAYTADFTAAALAALLQYRFAELLTDGERSAGMGYRTTIEFILK